MELDDLRNEDGVALFDEVLDDPSTDVLLRGEGVMELSDWWVALEFPAMRTYTRGTGNEDLSRGGGRHCV